MIVPLRLGDGPVPSVVSARRVYDSPLGLSHRLDIPPPLPGPFPSPMSDMILFYLPLWQWCPIADVGLYYDVISLWLVPDWL